VGAHVTSGVWLGCTDDDRPDSMGTNCDGLCACLLRGAREFSRHRLVSRECHARCVELLVINRQNERLCALWPTTEFQLHAHSDGVTVGDRRLSE
jgi:hypothetical protein